VTKDIDEQVQPEGMGEEMDLQVEGRAPRRKGGGFWAVTTLIFVVTTAVLAWLYTVQLDELAALRAEADQASSQVLRLRQANKQVSSQLAELMDKLREVVNVVKGVEGVEEPQGTAEPPAPEAAARPAEVEPAEAPESQPAEIAQPAEEEQTEAGPQPEAPAPRVRPVPLRR